MKKLLSLLLAISLLLLVSIPVWATEIDSKGNDSPYSIAIIEDTRATNPQLLSAKSVSLSTSDLNNLSLSELQNYDLVAVNNAQITSLSKETVVALLQSGGVLCIDTADTNDALSAVFSLLDEEKPFTIETSGLEHIGAYITMRNGNIVPGIITKGSVSIAGSTVIPATTDAIMVESTHLIEKIDVNNFLDHVFSNKNSALQMFINSNSVRMAPSGFVREFDNYTTFNAEVIANNVIGSVYITQYIYDVCTYRTDSKTIEISDVISHIVVDAGEISCIKTYDTKIRSDFGAMSIIDQTYLLSNSNTSVSLSGGFTAETDDVLSGEIGASTTYTYDTNNQTITNNFSSNTYNCWNVDPTKNWTDASWVLEPGVRVKNSHASLYSSSAYTSVEEIAFRWYYMGAQNGTEVYTSPLSVGGYW